MGDILKIIRNKKTNQLLIALSRKKLNLKGKNPTAIELDKIKLHFEKVKEEML